MELKFFFLVDNCNFEINGFLISNCSFKNGGLFEGSKTHFIGIRINIFETSFSSFENSIIKSDFTFFLFDFSIKNCTLQNMSIFKVYQRNNSEELYFFLFNSSFINIYQVSTEIKIPLILDYKAFNGESFFFNLNFEDLFTYNYILSITNSLKKIYIFNLLFSYCYSYDGIFIHSTNETYLWNICFKNQNNAPEIKGDWFKLGSCIFLLSLNRMFLKNITITEAISNRTTSGLKLINNFTPLQNNNEHLLENLNFVRNKVFYFGNMNISCSVLIQGHFFLKIISSFFKGNELDGLLKTNYKIGGPCIHFYSEKGSLNIETSKFYSNAAKFYSNYIEFHGNTLTITTSFFQN